MTNTFKRIVLLFTISLIFVVTVSVIFFQGEMKNAQAVENVDQLTGQRIGTPSAYEGDYILTNRDDITLLRYDTEADCLMALYYKRVDALALTEDVAKHMMSLSTGLKINETPIDKNGLCTLFVKNSIWADRFNEWIKEYKLTPEYKEYIEKVENEEFYDGSSLPEETGTGEKVIVGYVEDYIPVTFYDSINHCPNGSEVEIFIRFANDNNYQIEWIPVTETNGTMMIASKQLDCVLTGYSDVYRAETEASIYSELSDNYRDSKIVLLEVEDYDNFSFVNFIDEAEGAE